MKRLLALLIFVPLLTACNTIPKSVIARHPRIQDICKRAHGCQFVTLECTRYGNDGVGYGKVLNNQTFIQIGTLFGENTGTEFYDNGTNGFDKAVEDAITDYWHNDSKTPTSANCSEDCK
jgi:hypothetical protein